MFKKFSFDFDRVFYILGKHFQAKNEWMLSDGSRVNRMEISKRCDKREDKWLHDGKHRGLLLIYESPTELPQCHTRISAADPQDKMVEESDPPFRSIQTCWCVLWLELEA